MALAFRQAPFEDRTPGAGDGGPRRRKSRPRPTLYVVAGAAAIELDRRLLALSGRAARCRLVEGHVAIPLLARRGWNSLGFVRLSDYSRERLGTGARTIEESVRVATSLAALPRTTSAFLDGTLSWTATRLVTGIACARDKSGDKSGDKSRDESRWIEKARSVDTRTLASMIRESRVKGTGDTGSTGEAGSIDEAADDPNVRWSIRVSHFGRRLWRAARELAERSAGSTLTPARVLELVAAEAASGPTSPLPEGRAVDESVAASARSSASGCLDASGATSMADERNTPSPMVCKGYDWLDGLETRDPSLAAFLAELAREKTGACGASDAVDGPRAGVDGFAASPAIIAKDCTAACRAEAGAYDWRAGLAERDPQLAAFLADVAARGRLDNSPDNATGGTNGNATNGNDGPDTNPAHGNGAASIRHGNDGSTRTEGNEGDIDEDPRDVCRPFDDVLAEIAATEGFAWLAAPVSACATGPAAWLEAHLHQLESTDPFVIDERLRQVRIRAQRIDFELAGLLREAARFRLYRDLGFKSLGRYVESRLGICERTAWTLLAIERVASRRSPTLAVAWRDGTISTLAAHALLPVLGRDHDDAWILRARTVTLRRLEAEVAWAADRVAADHTAEPPPAELALAAAALAGIATEELQMRARSDETDVGNTPSGATSEELQMRARPAQPDEATAAAPAFVPCVQIAFFAPQSVASLAEQTMSGLRVGSEPRGSAFERMLALVLLEWMAAPAHRDPVFERDGWRCAVPGCTSRRNLHDHHVVFRSFGGDNARDNRITVCAAHHLHGLHRGRIRARGAAPHAVLWELGVRFGSERKAPLCRLFGDRYLEGDASTVRHDDSVTP